MADANCSDLVDNTSLCNTELVSLTEGSKNTLETVRACAGPFKSCLIYFIICSNSEVEFNELNTRQGFVQEQFLTAPPRTDSTLRRSSRVNCE